MKSPYLTIVDSDADNLIPFFKTTGTLVGKGSGCNHYLCITGAIYGNDLRGGNVEVHNYRNQNGDIHIFDMVVSDP